MKNPTIISLGGSIVVPDAIDTGFLAGFKKLIESQIQKGKEFVIVIGGGKTCRRYQAAAKEIVPSVSSADLDWIGIHTIRLNAELIRVILSPTVHQGVIIHPSGIREVKTPLAVAGAERPGHSSDLDAVLLAEETGAKKIVNLSNIDYVYTKDPRQFPDAKRIEKASWKEFRALIPPADSWKPGLSSPFDPVAAKKADELGLEVAIMNGTNLLNLENYLEGKPFTGTVIH